MANEFIVRTGLKVTGSAEISSSLKVADLAAGAGKVLNIGTGGKLESSGYALNQDLNTTSTPTFSGLTINGTASIAYLSTVFESASVIYSSGSNIFGDASNDVQTLYGTVNVMNGPTNFTGSVNSLNGFTGSLLGTASLATVAETANTAVLLDNQLPSYYLDASNIDKGTLNNAYLPSTIQVSEITSSFNGNLTGTSSYATQALTASYASNVPATASYALEALTASYATQALNSLYSQTASLANKANLLENSLSNGDGISLFTFNGSSAQTVALDSSVVRTTGNQTIAGVKTFTDNVVLTPASTQQTILNKQQSVSVNTSTTTVSSLSVTNVDAVFFDYVVKNSTTDLRTGTVMAVTNGSTVEYTEISTNDIGNTSGVTLSVDLNSGNIRLRATATSGTWTVRAFARTI